MESSNKNQFMEFRDMEFQNKLKINEKLFEYCANNFGHVSICISMKKTTRCICFYAELKNY